MCTCRQQYYCPDPPGSVPSHCSCPRHYHATSKYTARWLQGWLASNRSKNINFFTFYDKLLPPAALCGMQQVLQFDGVNDSSSEEEEEEKFNGEEEDEVAEENEDQDGEDGVCSSQ